MIEILQKSGSSIDPKIGPIATGVIRIFFAGMHDFCWILLLPKLGLIKDDDIETGRSTGSDYWDALHWLNENQNKRP